MAKTETRNIAVKPASAKKPAAPAKPAPARTIKVAAKKEAPVEKAKAAPVKVAPKANKFYVLAAFVRPVAGARLFAHTHAAFTLFGLFAAKSSGVKKTTLEALIGPRAVKYHTEKGTLESAADRIKLSVYGANFFAARLADGKLDKGVAEKYLAVMKNGTPDTDLGVRSDQIMPVFMEV